MLGDVQWQTVCLGLMGFANSIVVARFWVALTMQSAGEIDGIGRALCLNFQVSDRLTAPDSSTPLITR